MGRVKENINILFLLSIALIFGVTMFWCIKKQDMYIDEIYTYGLSNSFFAPFITDVPEDGSLIDKVLTKDDFVDYLTVSEKYEAFRYDSVYYNQTNDTQPPLYYMMLHTLCSIFRGEYSKWLGLSINLLLYLGVNILLYQIGKWIFDSKKYAVIAVLVYGLSWGGISTALMIRMYMLLTFWSLLFLYFILKLFAGKNKKQYYVGIYFIMFLGLFTQYFFVIFAFFVSALYCFKELIERHFKRVILYAISAFGGIITFYLIWPSIVDHLFSDKLVSGKTAVANMMDYKGMLLSIYSFFCQTAASFKPAILLLIISLLFGIFSYKKNRKQITIEDIGIRDVSLIMIMVSTGLAIILTAIVSPVNAFRYVYNVLPMIVLCIVYFIAMVWKTYENMFWILLTMTIAVCASNAFLREPEFVQNTRPEYYSTIQRFCNLPCVYLDDNYYEPLTDDMLQLIQFDEIYVTDDFWGEKTQQYLDNKNCNEGIILYIDISSRRSNFDSEKILININETTEFKSCELLFKDAFAETYLLL